MQIVSHCRDIEIIFVIRNLPNLVISWRHPRILSPFFSVIAD